jgi:uncharacterized delta-60 repeat protein/uncharacterized repeat protein (TIGR01451 family)
MALVLISFTGARAFAGGGCLDPSFGNAGKVTTNFTTQSDYIAGIVLQQDGKIVAAGTAGVGPALTDRLALARYNVDGSLDATFGTGGRVSEDFGAAGAGATSLALQPDGKIVVAGQVGLNPRNYDSAVVRYLPSGALDTSFGGGGLVTIDFSGQHDTAVAVVLQPDGKIVTLNHAENVSPNSRWALVRYLPDGSLDATFGSAGRVITDVGPEDDRPTTLVLQPDGKLLAGGLTLAASRRNQIALARYSSDGTLDVTFGTAGIVKTGLTNANAGAFGLSLLPSGEILVAGGGPGSGAPDFGDLLLARYTSGGALDTTFGTGGYVLTDVNGTSNQALSIAQTPDGRSLLAGFTWHPSEASNFALVGYRPDGRLDTSFGVDGKVVTDFFGGSDGAAGLLLLGDGRIVLGGGASTPPDDSFGSEFALARYLPFSCPDVAVTLSDSPDPAAVGQSVTYTATVTNHGPGEATQLTLTETLTGNLTLASTTPSQGSCSTAGTTIVCGLATLASGASATVTLVVVPPVVGVIGATATVAADGADPNPANDTATATTSVTNRSPSCDLAKPMPKLLWPPTHDVRQVSIQGVDDPDGDPVALMVTEITQDEPTRSDRADPAPDGAGIGSRAWLRAERDDQGNGRVYAVHFTARDDRGGMCSGSVKVGVPRQQSQSPIDDGQIYDSTSH